MEIVLLLAVLILVIILFNKNSNHQKTYQNDMNILKKKIDELSRTISKQNTSTLPTVNTLQEEISVLREELKVEEKPSVEEPIYNPHEENYEEELNTNYDESLTEELTENKEVDAEEETSSIAAFSSEDIASEVSEEIAKPYIQEPPKPYVPKKSWLETFREKNPDIEKFIGENLINKIGILILVLGINLSSINKTLLTDYFSMFHILVMVFLAENYKQ